MKVPLSTYLPGNRPGIGNWLLRPHEVLEDALRDSLTANDHYGSGTDLASTTADIAAVRTILAELEPSSTRLRAPIFVSNAEANSSRHRMRSNGPRQRRGVPVTDLPARQREQIDADAGAAAETLRADPGPADQHWIELTRLTRRR